MRMYVALFSCMSKSGRNQACFITLSSKSKSLFGCQNLGPFISQPYLGPDMVIIHIRRCASSSSLPAPLHLMQVGPQASAPLSIYIFKNLKSKLVSKINDFLTNLEKECP